MTDRMSSKPQSKSFGLNQVDKRAPEPNHASKQTSSYFSIYCSSSALEAAITISAT